HNARPGWPAQLETLRGGEVALAIACSRDVANELADFAAPVRTIWNGIAPRTQVVRRRAASLALLTVANHRPQKRLESLPRVVAELRDRGHDASLTIVGEPIRSDPASLA